MFSLLAYKRQMEFWRDMREIFTTPIDKMEPLFAEVKSPQKQQPKDDRARNKKRKTEQ
ncbi:hypothetical protein [Comamonas odontotermitis]|uniref:hypothetical protein n=1 Tax=Comamonas odontotermitis TaxID=379895 RepID=UPI001CC4DB95|nr:hypothetical protein [Comamonas odontotermitis]UBB17774.1 hypothetical protein LAD35_03770 [Comamonas odontotermitis]